jgi:hypothetical protein
MWKSALASVTLAVMTSTSFATDSSVPNLDALQAKDPKASIQSLYNACTADDAHDQMFCAGYISATMDTLSVLGAAESAKTFGMCPKVRVSYGAAVQVFKNWAQNHPETWSFHRFLGVSWALKEAWPCA